MDVAGIIEQASESGKSSLVQDLLVEFNGSKGLAAEIKAYFDSLPEAHSQRGKILVAVMQTACRHMENPVPTGVDPDSILPDMVDMIAELPAHDQEDFVVSLIGRMPIESQEAVVARLGEVVEQ